MDTLCFLLERLGLAISSKNLVPPCTCAIFLGVCIDTTKRTVSIPEEKLCQIKVAATNLVSKKQCEGTRLE